jgi:hypothetical protein
VTADRGFADVALFGLLTELRVAFVIRVKNSTQVCLAGVWRLRDAQGKWGLWYVVANRPYAAAQAVAEYAHRPGCEAGFRDAKWWLGFAPARVKQISAWSRRFALFAMARLVVASLATRLLLRGDQQASALLRRVASRRRGRCELSLVSAMISLLHQDPGLYDHLAPRMKLKLQGGLANVS